MKTSYFSCPGLDISRAVAISQGVPKSYKGRVYKALAPSWALIKIKDMEVYTQRYKLEVLARLDPRKVYEDLGEDAILLCWEKPGEPCHRRLVAEWLEESIGIKVPEYNHPGKKIENPAFSQQSLF